MTVPGSANPLLLCSAAPTAYQVSRSLRFNSADSAYLSRTPGSAGNRKTFTWSAWVKRSSIGSSYEILFSARAGTSSNRDYLTFQNDQLVLTCSNSSGTTTANVQSTAVFRDASAWYHLVLAVDTTQATAANRVRMYVNGSEITTFSVASYPSQNTDLSYNEAQPHTIGQSAAGTAFSFNGYLANIEFVDGSQLTPSSFAETDATTGQWVPKLFSGSYGSQGWKLTFADNSNNTASTLGADTSGNGNNWTPNNLSVTAGAGNDSLTDTPASYGSGTSGGDVRGNFATLNPLVGVGTLSNGNLEMTGSGASDNYRHATIGVSSGKWYFEATITSATTAFTGIGVYGANVLGTLNGSPSRGYGSTAVKYSNGATTSYGATFTSGDVIGCAFDVDSGKIWFSKNGTWQASGDPAAGTNAAYTDLAGYTLVPSIQGGTSMGGVALNFGQRAFAYTPPANFKPLVDTYLPTPTVAKPSEVMDVIAYSGSGASRTFTDLSYSPDLVWIKHRSGANNHRLYDAVRGTTKALYSNLTNSEGTDSTGLTAFTSNGFTLGDGDAVWNASGQTYVAWCWDAGTSTVTNTQGSITSQVRTNGYLSIVTYTGTGANATIGHGGLANLSNGMIIIKNRSSATNWRVYHSALGNTKVIFLSTTGTPDTNSVYWNNTSPTSTVFSVGSDDGVNGNGNAMVAYCFAPVAGYSSFGSYTGNGSADGPFVFCNFRPRWVMLKRSSSSGTGWQIHDTSRNTYNVMNNRLQPSNSDAESTYTTSDFLSNGFKLRDSDPSWNSNGETYIYAAFAENPFQYARAR